MNTDLDIAFWSLVAFTFFGGMLIGILWTVVITSAFESFNSYVQYLIQQLKD